MLVTEEERDRKALEDKEIKLMRELVRREVDAFLQTAKGEETLRLKVKELKQEVRDSLAQAKESLKDMDIQLGTLKREAESVKQRSQKFDSDPGAVELHAFVTADDRDAAVKASEVALSTHEEKIKGVKERMQQYKLRRKQKAAKWREDASAAIILEKQQTATAAIVEEGRIDAMKAEQRRPWDGDEGEAFKKWMAARRGKDSDDEDGEDSDADEESETDEDEDEDEDDDRDYEVGSHGAMDGDSEMNSGDGESSGLANAIDDGSAEDEDSASAVASDFDDFDLSVATGEDDTQA